jgi:hypothetical protein
MSPAIPSPDGRQTHRTHHDSNGLRVYIFGSPLREVMVEVPNSLIIDLLVFLKAGPRPYQEVMDAWRTSCPRLPIWEDAVDLGLIEREQGFVVLTEAGRNLLPS